MMPPIDTLSLTNGDIMTGLQILGYFLAFIVGAGLGASGYRYMLKRDPERLEALAAQAKRTGDRVKDRFGS